MVDLCHQIEALPELPINVSLTLVKGADCDHQLKYGDLLGFMIALM
jgi:hypothetical protein